MFLLSLYGIKVVVAYIVELAIFFGSTFVVMLDS